MSYRYPSTSSLSDHNHSHSHSGGGHSHSHSHSGYGRYPSTSSLNSGYSGSGGGGGGYSRGSGQRPDSFSSGYGSGYTSPGYVSPSPGYVSPILSPTFKYPSSSPLPTASPTMIYDVNSAGGSNGGELPREQTEYERSLEYHQAPDTFPCGHVLCHKCLRKFMHGMGGLQGARCPVCRLGVSGEDVSLASMGLPSGDAPPEEAPISLLNNFGEIVKKFNGIQQSLRRLKDESVQSRSMGMTYTNTLCHMCCESHPTLRIIQEHNHLQVRHERPNAWSNYFYKLQQGKIVTTFYSKVNSSTICVPCTYRELLDSKAVLPADMKAVLPNLDPSRHQQMALAAVGKIVAKNVAPLMALQGKNVIEVDHTIKVRERADHFDFLDTAQQIENMVQQQEESLLQHAMQQMRDTGHLYHVTESNQQEIDNDETTI